MIRREECDRVEAEHGRAGNSVADCIAFQHDDDFRNLRLGQLRVTLGRLQGGVEKHLYEASLSGDGWCFGKSVLVAVGSTSKRMSDVFKSKPESTLLVESDGRGQYRFRARIRSTTHGYAARRQTGRGVTHRVMQPAKLGGSALPPIASCQAHPTNA